MMREYELLQEKYEALQEELAKLQKEVAELRKQVGAGDEDSRYRIFVSHQDWLTPTERIIYDLYLSGKNTVQVQQVLGITENTLKYHNRNLYSKLAVSSRKQLVKYGQRLRQEREQEGSRK